MAEYINTEQIQRAANTFDNAVDQMQKIVNQFDEIASRLTPLLGTGYGSSVEHLIEELRDFNNQSIKSEGENNAAGLPLKKLTDYGQVNEGDFMILDLCGQRMCLKAHKVLQKGTVNEEVVYNRKKNFYFITSMVLDGTSNHKNVFIVDSIQPSKES